MEYPEGRWKQRLQSFGNALDNLKWAVDYAQTQSQKQQELTILEEAGLIQFFEFTYELAWKTLQDYFRSQGVLEGAGPRVAFETAIQNGLIENRESWRELKESRELASHTYSNEQADEIAKNIIQLYFPLLETLYLKLLILASKDA